MSKDIDEILSNQLKPYVEKGYRVILTGEPIGTKRISMAGWNTSDGICPNETH